MLRAKEQAGRRPAYVSNLKLYLNRFSKEHAEFSLEEITPATLEKWIEQFPGQHYRSTWKNRLSTLFAFAVRRGYLSENPCDKLEPVSVDLKPAVIFTIEQCRTMLHFVRRQIPRFIPWLVLALFAGVRPEELDRLTWQDVDLAAKRVTISAAASKVHRRRVTPLEPAAVAWLKFGGDLPIPHVSRRRYVRRMRSRLGLAAWPQDALRHTAASMMLAREQDAGKVALWLGNSPKILLSHYHQIVSGDECRKFWELEPF